MDNLGIIIDYIVFGLVLTVSLGIGLFYARKQKSTHEYIHGSGKMGLLPVSVSLFVSFVSALTMQGMPAEVYMYGIQIAFAMLALWGILLATVTFLPIYYYMKPASIYEYLEQRYNSKIPKLVACILSLASTILYCGVAVYGPSAGLESFTGISTDYSIIAMVVVCTIYTSLGGLRGVMWTDVFQAFVMVFGFCIVIIMGLAQVGVSTVWEELEKYGRTEINFSFTLVTRNSFWICLVCIGFQWFVLFSLQTAMLRYTSLPTKRQAIISVVIGGFGCIFLMFLACTVGAIIFAYYSRSGCDPLAKGLIYTSNQVVPYYVVTVLNYPGIPGIFLAAIVASSLSSVSSIQNAITVLLWSDILSPILPKMKDMHKALLMKITTLIIGVLTVIVAFVAKYTEETLYNLAFMVLDVLIAPSFGMFILGAGFTFTSSIGALVGCTVSSTLCLWISMGKMIHGTTLDPPQLVNNNCTVPEYNHTYSGMTQTMMSYTEQPGQENFAESLWIYDISSYANPTIGMFLTVIVGLIVSAIPAFRHKEKVNTNLLFPVTNYILRYTNRESRQDFHMNAIDEETKTLSA